MKDEVICNFFGLFESLYLDVLAVLIVLAVFIAITLLLNRMVNRDIERIYRTLADCEKLEKRCREKLKPPGPE